MTPRLFLISVFAVLAFAVVPALAQHGGGMAQPPSNPQVPIPPAAHSDYSCAASTGRVDADALSATCHCLRLRRPIASSRSIREARASNSTVTAFNKDYKAYGECIRKYVDDNRAWIDAVVETNNRAVEEYNKYTTDLKKLIDAAKE